ncbi:MAG: hypothetical protein ACXQTC_05270 [Methanopyraceae archaeon]
MRPLAVLLAALTALMGPALAEEESFKVAVVLPYHGSYDPHWVYKAHQLPEKLQEYLSATFSEGYDIKVYPGEFETFGVTEVTLQGGKTYEIHQESIRTEEETLETEFGYALKQAAQFTNKGKDGLIVILPAFLNRGGQHQGVEIPELIERVLVEDQKVPRYAYVYQQFGIASWDRQDDLGVVPELMYGNVKEEEKKRLVNISDSNLQNLLSGIQNPTLGDLINKVKDELGLLVIAFGTLRVSYWQDYKANIEYVLKRLAEKLGIDRSKAKFFAFNNPEIGPEKWEKSRWSIRYDNFKQVMQELNKAGVKYVLVVPYLTVTGITDRKLFEGNPKQGEPDVYDYKEAILRHFNAQLAAETQADKEQYTYVQDGKRKSATVYINTRIYKISKDQLGTSDDMYVIYVRRGVLDAPNAVEAVAKVLASYISLQLPAWRHRYETLKELEGGVSSVSREVQQVKQRVEGLQGQVKGLEKRVSKLERRGGKRGKGPVLPVLALVALLPLAARRR